MLSNQMLLEILQDWSFWDHTPNYSLIREIALPNKLQSDLALIIEGVRRCGKSTLLTQLPQKYGLNLSDCYYCNFEDPRLLDALDHNLLNQIVKLAREGIASDHPRYFFLDEIQNVANWEKWLHTQLDRPKNNYFILTGSNSCLLNNEFATSLTGRHITIKLFPFSLTEFKHSLPHKNLEDYLLIGGFPKPLTLDEPYKLLQEYFNDIILRDVVTRVNARTQIAIKQVIKMTFDSCGSDLSFRKIAASVGITPDTVKSYLEACEHAYLIFSCPFFAFSEKKRLLRHKKYYPIDPGLRYAITNTQNRDFGKSLELLVFLQLKKTYDEVFYWQEIHQGEVDFVVQNGKDITPFQVTWEGVESRHEKALEHFYAAFPYANEAIFITKENATEFLSSSVPIHP